MNEQELRADVIYEIKHGSTCYGTNIPGSDTDFFGVALLRNTRYYFGTKSFEQKSGDWDDGNDRVIYELRRFFSLAKKCSPGVIEALWCDPQFVVTKDLAMEWILSERDCFLSAAVGKTYASYGINQLKLAKKSIEKGDVKTKQLMHMIRVLRMSKEILKNQSVVVFRPDRDELKAIRFGLVPVADCIKEAESLVEEIQKLEGTTALPPQPDLESIENLLVDVLTATLIFPKIPRRGM